MALGQPSAMLANEFYRKYGPRPHLMHFVGFIKSKKLDKKVAEEVQEVLVKKYGLNQIVHNIQLDEKKKDPETEVVKAFVKAVKQITDLPRDVAPTTPSIKAAISTVVHHNHGGGSKVRIKRVGKHVSHGPAPSSGVRPNKPKKKKKKKHLGEGLGFSDDADGRGKGINGGSWYSEYDRTPGDARDQNTQRCKRCGGLMDGQSCTVCGTEAGAAGQQPSGFGNVRVPGGPLDTNEGGYIRLKAVGETLVEIEIAGVRTTHSRPVATEAIRHRLTHFGSSYKQAFPKLVEWLWQKAGPGDELIIDLSGQRQYVINREGFLYNWGAA